MTIHPGQSGSHSVLEQLILHPSRINEIVVEEVPDSGFVVSVTEGDQLEFYPEAVNVNADTIRFLTNEQSLNQFGFAYVSLFILSNLSRYYPEVWSSEIENYTEMYRCVDVFMRKVSNYVPKLFYGELHRRVFLSE